MVSQQRHSEVRLKTRCASTCEREPQELLWHRTPRVFGAARWTLEAEAKEPDAPCRRVNSIYTMHAVMVEVQFKHDGYDILSELGMPQVRGVFDADIHTI